MHRMRITGLDTLIYNSTFEFVVGRVSNDSVVPHMISYVDTLNGKLRNMQIYFDGVAIYLLNHSDKTYHIVSCDSTYIRHINFLEDYVFIPFILKSDSRFARIDRVHRGLSLIDSTFQRSEKNGLLTYWRFFYQYNSADKELWPDLMVSQTFILNNECNTIYDVTLQIQSAIANRIVKLTLHKVSDDASSFRGFDLKYFQSHYKAVKAW
jgi:hypothetical protein